MPRLLVVSWVFAAACASNAGNSSSTTPSASGGQQPGMVCNDEAISPRGSVGPRCFTKSQLEEQKRFSSSQKLDPTPRQTYNN